jgi:hypothetical protein
LCSELGNFNPQSLDHRKVLAIPAGKHETSLHGGRRNEGIERAETVRFRVTPKKLICTLTDRSIDMFDRARCYERVDADKIPFVPRAND